LNIQHSKFNIQNSINFLASLNITIAVISAIVLTVTINILIENYGGMDADKFPAVISALQPVSSFLVLEDLEHSWWFITLLILFAVNLLACTLNRIPRTINIMRPMDIGDIDSAVSRLPIKEHITASDLKEDFRKKVPEILGPIFRRPVFKDKGERSFLLAEKGRYSFVGFYLAHLGLLLILIGTLLTWTGGPADCTLFLKQGESFDRFYIYKNEFIDERNIGMTVRLDRLEYTESPKSADKNKNIHFKSTFTVARADKKIKTAAITGFEIFKYKNIRIAHLRKMKKESSSLVTLSVRPKLAGANPKVYKVKEFDTFTVPETGHLIRIGGIRLFDTQKGPLTGAGLVIQVFGKGNKLLFRAPVSSNRGNINPSAANSKGRAWFKDYEFRVLRVKKVPPSVYGKFRVSVESEAVLLWWGTCTAILGFTMMFLCSHCKILVMIEKKDGVHHINLAGWDSRNPDKVKDVFDEIKRIIFRRGAEDTKKE
jgi:cytochrome c biogenesis protein